MRKLILILIIYLSISGCLSSKTKETKDFIMPTQTQDINALTASSFPCPGIPSCKWVPSRGPNPIISNSLPKDLKSNLSESELNSIMEGDMTAYQITGWLCRRGCSTEISSDTEIHCNGPNSDVKVNMLAAGELVLADIKATFSETKPNYTVIKANGYEEIGRFTNKKVTKIIPDSFEIAWDSRLGGGYCVIQYDGTTLGWVTCGSPQLRKSNQPFYTNRNDYNSMPHGPRILITNHQYTKAVWMFGDSSSSRDDLNVGFYIHIDKLYVLVEN